MAKARLHNLIIKNTILLPLVYLGFNRLINSMDQCYLQLPGLFPALSLGASPGLHLSQVPFFCNKGRVLMVEFHAKFNTIPPQWVGLMFDDEHGRQLLTYP